MQTLCSDGGVAAVRVCLQRGKVAQRVSYAGEAKLKKCRVTFVWRGLSAE